jgi:hypothetical protein
MIRFDLVRRADYLKAQYDLTGDTGILFQLLYELGIDGAIYLKDPDLIAHLVIKEPEQFLKFIKSNKSKELADAVLTLVYRNTTSSVPSDEQFYTDDGIGEKFLESIKTIVTIILNNISCVNYPEEDGYDEELYNVYIKFCASIYEFILRNDELDIVSETLMKSNNAGNVVNMLDHMNKKYLVKAIVSIGDHMVNHSYLMTDVMNADTMIKIIFYMICDIEDNELDIDYVVDVIKKTYTNLFLIIYIETLYELSASKDFKRIESIIGGDSCEYASDKFHSIMVDAYNDAIKTTSEDFTTEIFNNTDEIRDFLEDAIESDTIGKIASFKFLQDNGFDILAHHVDSRIEMDIDENFKI